MAEAWWGVGAHGDTLCGLLIELCALDDVFDELLLAASLLVVTPPHWPLVLALEAEVFAGATRGLSLIALLPSQATCEAPCTATISYTPERRIPAKCWRGKHLPVLERRCILAACAFAELAAFAVPTMVADCLVDEVGAVEEDMDS